MKEELIDNYLKTRNHQYNEKMTFKENMYLFLTDAMIDLHFRELIYQEILFEDDQAVEDLILDDLDEIWYSLDSNAILRIEVQENEKRKVFQKLKDYLDDTSDSGLQNNQGDRSEQGSNKNCNTEGFWVV